MAETKREIERKYESDDGTLPDLTGVGAVAAVLDQGLVELDATYYDTADQRLAAASLTLRRRTGGSDAGWHLKLPVAPGVRDEIRAPLSDTLPEELAALVRSRTREARPVPLVRLRSARDVRHLVDADGALLAEASVDTVTAERLTGAGGTARWTEIEVELADGGDPAFLDQVEKHLARAGVRPSASSSKLARALELTGGARRPPVARPEPVTAGDHVLAYLRAQRDALVALDPAVRLGTPDAVHRMRVATRRARSTLRTFRAVLDRAATEPVAAELKWLAGELGVDRDQEVLAERLTTALDALPPALDAGRIHERLTSWARTRVRAAPAHLAGVLDSARHLALLNTLDALLADPPLRKAAARKPEKVLGKAVQKDLSKLTALVERALALPPGTDRDLALHEARKKAKRARYAAEAAAPALGAPVRRLTSAMKTLTTLLGDHQDSVMARRTLRELAAVAHAAGESAFPYGVLYGREEARAAAAEAELPARWRRAADRFPG
ncbi:CHAD domain-containing protein [Streptomyces sp. SID8366]|uniref:CYTH and CHAD domain-containing protein n=1 Tax=unclassified Streptomyces TaxID=2593676 RepID=UPI000DBA9301|nr:MULTISPECIES: CYTH and CHAD domain-containing protein [unclassified Streptomyces]MYU08929.1 CHAD domain-containing protein [Streptomyces sp. SID8366]MYU67750.1 CHAD domain-containing protein [Streptomyces sp. SID69]RAJ52436.1 CHAD domain-containing protein [Streptomyces sp. PsTaAH-130]